MLKIILDTSFILTCIKEKIDFLEAGEYGKLLIPKQVILELKKKQEKGGMKERENASVALEIIGKKDKLQLIDLKKKFVDAGIKNYVKSHGKEQVAVATLDRELKRELRDKAKILTIRARKKLILE